MVLSGLCKDLLAKYTPDSQVQIILDELLPVCPHPGLRPKLLDLLRPLVACLRSQRRRCSFWLLSGDNHSGLIARAMCWL